MSETAVTGSKAWITAAVAAAAFIATLDIAIVNVALSDIRARLNTPLDQVAWLSTAYMMANVATIPLTGWLQRRFGVRRTFVGAVLVFTAASALCGAAWSFGALVGFRIVQGVGGGACIPTAQSILFARYPRSEHAMANAIFGLAGLTAPLLGPALGGWLVEVASWHWIFLVNVPVGCAAAAVGWVYIREPGFAPTRAPVDAAGIGLLVVGLAALQYTLEEGHREGWADSRLIVTTGAVAVAALATFVVHELETPHPVVDLRVFANRSYAAGSAINFAFGVVVFAGSVMFSLFCGVVLRYRALDIGVLFLRANWVQLLVLPVIGRLGPRVDGRYLLAAGIGLVVATQWLNGHLTHLADTAALVQPMAVRAVALGCIFVPLNVIALSDLPTAQRGNAAGLFSLTRELGGSIGTAVATTLLDQRLHAHAAVLGQNLAPSSPALQLELARLQSLSAPRTWDPGAAALTVLARRVELQSAVRAFNDVFLAIGAFVAASAALVLLLRRARATTAAVAAH